MQETSLWQKKPLNTGLVNYSFFFLYAIFQEVARDKAASEKSSNHHLAAYSGTLVLCICSGHNFVNCEVKRVDIPEL